MKVADKIAELKKMQTEIGALERLLQMFPDLMISGTTFTSEALPESQCGHNVVMNRDADWAFVRKGMMVEGRIILPKHGETYALPIKAVLEWLQDNQAVFSTLVERHAQAQG